MAHGKFEFNGTGGSFLWHVIWTSILTAITFGIFFPWAYAHNQKWIAERAFINGKQLCFKGTGAGFFGTWLLIVFLSIITIGIYIPWGFCRLKRWQVNNLYFADTADVEKH